MNTLGEFVPIDTILQGSTWKRRVAFSPSIHIEETRAVPGEVIAGKEHRKSNEQWQRLGLERYVHRSLHVCPHATTPPPWIIPTPDDPPDQPHFLSTQQEDWRFWKMHRDFVFEGKGTHRADPAWDRVRALAEDIWTFRFTIQKPGGNDFSREMPWSQPTTALIYGSWCAGCAPALIALCATIGVPARMVQIVDHAMVEAWIDGAWCLIDNVTQLANEGGNMMLRASLADVLLDPTNPDWKFTPTQQGKYWEKTVCSYSSSTGLQHEEPRITFLTPQNALALYPGWTDVRFKSHRADTYDLVWGRPGRSHPSLILKQGQAFRRRFWLGSLAETAALTATFSGGDASPQVPEGGGDWFVAVNGRRHPVRDSGGWLFHTDAGAELGRTCYLTDLAWVHRFDVPPGDLRENDWNEIAIGSTGSGAEFLSFGGHCDWILPEEACFCPRVDG